MPLILILRPIEWFGIVVAELKRVASLGQFMMVEGTVRSRLVDNGQEDLHLLAELCEELRPDSLYARYANKKVFRHEEDFWTTKEKMVRVHVKQMADRRIIKAVGLADKLDIPIIYAKDQKAPLHISERLTLDSGSEVTPVMNFSRHAEGTTYRLQLRIGERLVERPSEHQLIVLTHTPGMFVLDKRIYALCEGFSGQLLLPFAGKAAIEREQSGARSNSAEREQARPKVKEATKVAEPVSKPQAGMLFSDEEMRGEPTVCSQKERLHLPYRTSLVVAPASVVHNWRNELGRFAPSLSVMTYTGDTAKRKDKRTALMRWDVVLTTYRTLLNDIDLLSQNEFGIVVFDESQAFKTATSQIHQAVTRLQALHRMALSGTPVENNLQELWSLMNVLNPNLLGDARSFQDAFVNPIAVQMEDSRKDLLRRLIAPCFLKRTKEEVLSDLPERQDEVVVCAMTDEQTSRYTEELSKARNEWLDPTASSHGRQIHILAALQRLRQIANGEGKMGVVFDYLENLRQTQHKVLIFSEYVTLLEQVGGEMTSRGWNYALLTGQTQNREQVIARFQQSSDCQFFLISLKAGGVGLNLTAADYVFLLDPWWNRAAEEQAIARAHRIGQQRSVFVYRFVSAGTLEEQILTLQDRKQSLIDSVMPFIL